MRKVIVAETAGFCFGVKRSVDIALSALEEGNGNCCSLGHLIHNSSVIKELEAKGLRVAEAVEDIPEDSVVIIRAHGISEEVYNRLTSRFTIIDATCPKVKAIHKIVNRACSAGRFVIIIGAENHPEVIGISGWCGESYISDNAEELGSWLDNHPEICEGPVTVVVQTTQTRKKFQECCDEVKKRCTNIEISDTICSATSMRQNEAGTMAESCDAMIVIGGKNSANSVHLAQICKEKCGNTQFVEDSSELDLSLIGSDSVVGITAGASTPSWIIKEVRNKMSDEIKVEEAVVEKELSFDEMLEETLKPIYNGDKVNGVVVAITGTEVSVDLGAKYSGFIPTTEFTDDGIKVEDAVKVGDAIQAVVVRVNDVEGTAQLSKKRLDAAKAWIDVEEAVESGAVLEGVVTEENKGGVVVNVKGVRVFVPASQTDLPKDAELSQLLKKTVKLRITEVNKPRKRVVGSIRKVTQAEKRARIENIWNEIEVGAKYTGTVKSLTSYGAFVDIGGIDGMVHVSELSWGRVTKPSEVVNVGDVIEVYVISFDKEKRKISLGYKDPEANPWTVFTKQYSVGDTAAVKIVKLVEFGAFAEVVPGVDGLIHISQIADHRIAKPGDVLTVGDVVDAKITAVDDDKHKVSLSIRALSEPAKAEAPAEKAEDDGNDALVYSVSEDGKAEGEVPEAEN